MQALIFDCDGVLVDTERDGHRVAFNRAFAAKGLDHEWTVERYGVLLGTAGGKERLRRHFDETEWPVAETERKGFIGDLHRLKTDIFVRLIESGGLPLRSGVARLMDEAIEAGVTMAVCSTSDERAVSAIVNVLLGPDRAPHLSVFAGDMVGPKKPDPAIYNLASQQLGLDPSQCLVVEDSQIGLGAALAAGMNCVITTSAYTANQDFTGAARVLSELGDGDGTRLSLAECRALLGA